MNDREIEVRPLRPADASACLAIGRSLPAWFGVEEGLVDMETAARRGPGWIAEADENLIGFVTITRHFLESWEISWMAVTPTWHRCGVGGRLIQTVVNDAREHGIRFLQVKTLADTHPSPEYAMTRAFYLSQGFVPLEIFPELWGPENPALQLVMAITR